MNNLIARGAVTLVVAVAVIGAIFLAYRSFASRDDGQEAIFIEGLSLSEAKDQARADGTNVFVLALATWCPHCNELDREALSDDAVMKAIDETTVPVRVNINARSIDPQEWPDLDRLRVTEVPTLLLLDPAGREIDRVTGVVDPKALEVWIRTGGQVRPATTGGKGRLS